MGLGGYKGEVLKKVHGDDQLEQDDRTETLKGPLLDTLVHTLLAIIILAIGRFGWWFGFGLFFIFAIHILSRFVATGFFLILEGLIMQVVAEIVRYRGLNPTKFDEMLLGAKKLLWTNLVLGSVELYLLVLTILLGVSFFW